MFSGWVELRLPSESVCHEPWGCFSLQPHFTNIGYLPQSPDKLGVQFFLYTRLQGTQSTTRSRQSLALDWREGRMRELFDVSKDTRVILHGYSDNADRRWVLDMVERLLNRV